MADVSPLLAGLPAAAQAGALTLLERLRRHDDGHTYAHSLGVAVLAAACARQLRLPPEVVRHVAGVGLLHDVGKLAVDPAVLLKPGPLEPPERAGVRLHPVHGERVLRPLPGIVPIARSVRAHHERWDGTGYPDCLRGEQIPLPGRIVTLADAFDAMTRDRAYRAGLPVEVASRELARFAGSMFDPAVTVAFQDCLADLRHLVAAPPRDLIAAAGELLTPAGQVPGL